LSNAAKKSWFALVILFVITFVMIMIANRVDLSEQEILNRFNLRENRDPYGTAFFKKGTGPDILMIPGLLNQKSTFDSLANLLEKQFTIWAIDLKGTGWSQVRRTTELNLAGHVSQVREFLNGRAIQKVILVGSSYGGIVAQAFAANYPDRVSSIFLLNPSELERMNQKRAKWTLKVLSNLLGTSFGSDTASFFSGKTVSRYFLSKMFFDPKLISKKRILENAYPMKLPDYWKNFSYLIKPEPLLWIQKIIRSSQTLKIPAYVIWGNEDQTLERKVANRVVQQFGNGQIRVIPQCGHLPHEEKPEKVAKIIKSEAR